MTKRSVPLVRKNQETASFLLFFAQETKLMTSCLMQLAFQAIWINRAIVIISVLYIKLEVTMKRIEAIIKPDKLQDVEDSLKSLNIKGMSICQIMGCGCQQGWTEIVRGSQVDFHFLHKLKIELVVQDEEVEDIVQRICEVVRSGEVGDGKIFIFDVIDAVRIRTDERGKIAI
jgi:nitrogen regulatory protein P-II 1